MNVERVESFRTSLMNQKQRLMKQTQLQNTFDKSLIDKDLKKKEEDKSAKSIIFGALRKISGGSRKTSRESKAPTPPPSPAPEPVPAFSPQFLSPEPQPSPILEIRPKQHSPVVQQRKRTPVPSDSPLLSKPRQDPILKRIRSFNKSIKRASSFRQAREKASDMVNN